MQHATSRHMQLAHLPEEQCQLLCHLAGSRLGCLPRQLYPQAIITPAGDKGSAGSKAVG